MSISIINKIAGAEHTFAAYIEAKLAAIEGKAPQIERVIGTTLTYAGGALQIALSASGDTIAAAAAGKVIAQAQSDLQVGSSLVYDFGPNPTAASIFSSVSTNLNDLLLAGHVTNPTSTAAIKKVIGEVGVLGAAVDTAAKQIAASAGPQPPVPSKPLPLAQDVAQAAAEHAA